MWNPWIFILHFGLLLLFSQPSCVQPFATPWTAAHQASLSLTISWSLPKFMSIASVMPSSHLILWCPLLLLSSIFGLLPNTILFIFLLELFQCWFFGAFPMSLWYISITVLILPNFLALNDVPGSSCIFAIPDLESAVLQGALVPCVGYRY